MISFSRMFAVATIVIASLASPLGAQDSRGKVQGTVSDASGAVVVGATTTLVNTETGVSQSKLTGNSGQYLFDFVIPGTYRIQVDLAGFRSYVQKNVLVQARGDVTVDAKLEVGAVGDAVTVEDSPVAIQFNTSTMSLTLDTKMTNNLPLINRNPFLLASLDPAVVVRSSTEQNPFHHWAASQLDVGGSTSTKNDIVLDGAPSMTAQKSSYTPPMDAVEQVNLPQNAVDAEFGHSAGGVLSLQMKSGTNEFHGTAYYLGRNPVLNALADSVNRKGNLTRQHVWGGHTRRSDPQKQDLQLLLVRGLAHHQPPQRHQLPAHHGDACRRFLPGCDRQGSLPSHLRPVDHESGRQHRHPYPVRGQHHPRLTDRHHRQENDRRPLATQRPR